MEDQSADSSDLTADAAAASVPQGKAGRNRHRLPRQKASQVEHGEEAVTAEADPATEVSDTEAEPATEAPAEDAVETEEAVEAVEADEVVPAEPPRRRSRWRRGKADAVAVPAEAVTPAEPDPDVDPDVETPETAAVDAEAEAPEDVVLVPHRTAGRVLKLVAVAAGVLFVAACAFAGATVQPYLADRAAVHTKFVIAETAANAITTLWTYTPDDMDKLPERSAKYLGGDFAADYKRYIDAIVAPNKQAQVTNNTQVLGAAVESLTPTEATAIVYTNSVATSPVTKGIPSLRYLSYRLTMKPQDSRWLITQMVAVTKLDLTPRL
ncbi:mammalian cell entry protein [Mycolicibacterium sp. P1-18]|uniref:mammalian cell entry protein n=1 Tax=Mycolicibacterium sp. P1-18 TaxID=2024615 RepID=UPI0011F3BC84|nr:mammalian cell entry protein [Mycolicibacterium sp. P1-18]KAA0099880.1 mammalian cell entry protein [Mycolicibacterium sp. P1-18]